MEIGVWVAITTVLLVLLAGLVVTAGAVVGVAVADTVELWRAFPNEPIFGRTTTTATTAMRMITRIPATRRIFFLFLGFFGGGGTAVGIDDGMRGVGDMSFGEKSLGINRFFTGDAATGTAVADTGCSGTTGFVENGSEDNGCETSGAAWAVLRGSLG